MPWYGLRVLVLKGFFQILHVVNDRGLNGAMVQIAALSTFIDSSVLATVDVWTNTWINRPGPSSPQGLNFADRCSSEREPEVYA